VEKTVFAAAEPGSLANSAPSPPGRILVDVNTVAKKYGADKRSVYRFADAGIIPFGIKLGSLRKWDLAEIDSHIAAGCPRVRRTKANS
jgi:predicted DNA-binding transcriptional regulator AlpA